MAWLVTKSSSEVGPPFAFGENKKEQISPSDIISFFSNPLILLWSCTTKESFKMKTFILIACILGTALGRPQRLVMEFDFQAANAQALQAGQARPDLEIILPVGGGVPSGGFIKQEIPQPLGQESVEIYHPFSIQVAPPPPAPAAPAHTHTSDEEDD
ncbi:secretory calcium-binding phosphoprotein 7 [Oncorhynchus tshawytscha]|uniref:secretory calcium-binding phosphoprotein 7 n=1 Tax=Oncorhynchus tshawytscha TaxID=74940 RepID=UPI001C3CE972|nr:secretory calcium-binding phosphoprotein 7 [Oncorhynchus tshawytscha]